MINDGSKEVINCDIMIFQNIFHSKSQKYELEIYEKKPRDSQTSKQADKQSNQQRSKQQEKIKEAGT